VHAEHVSFMCIDINSSTALDKITCFAVVLVFSKTIVTIKK